ncbi:hypothetical protein V8C86DRAFT_2786196, partial [Haematococcus lacustris]
MMVARAFRGRPSSCLSTGCRSVRYWANTFLASSTSFFFSSVSALYTAALYLSVNSVRVVSRSPLLFLSDLANTTCTLWPVPYCVLLLALTELNTMWL